MLVHIYNNNSSTILTLTKGAYGLGQRNAIQFGSFNLADSAKITCVDVVSPGDAWGGSLEFATGYNNVTTTKMTISADGNLGIGTTTPSSKLEVVGDINTTGNYKINGSNVVTANNFIKAKGNVHTDGTLLPGSYNISGSTKPDTGTYIISFANPLPDDTYSVIVTCALTDSIIGVSYARLTTLFGVLLFLSDNKSLINAAFSFIVV